MPVVMRTSYGGSGDTFKYFRDGKPGTDDTTLAPSDPRRNVVHVDARDLTPNQIRALEEMDAQFRQREMQRPPAEAWRGGGVSQPNSGWATPRPGVQGGMSMPSGAGGAAIPSWATERPGVQGGMSPVLGGPVTADNVSSFHPIEMRGGGTTSGPGASPLGGPASMAGGRGTFGPTNDPLAGGGAAPVLGMGMGGMGGQSPGVPPPAFNPYDLTTPDRTVVQQPSGMVVSNPPQVSGAGIAAQEAVYGVPQWQFADQGYVPRPGTGFAEPGYVPEGHPAAAGPSRLGARPLLPQTQTPQAGASQTPVVSPTNTPAAGGYDPLSSVRAPRDQPQALAGGRGRGVGEPVMGGMEGQTITGDQGGQLKVVRETPDGLLLEIEVNGQHYQWDSTSRQWRPTVPQYNQAP